MLTVTNNHPAVSTSGPLRSPVLNSTLKNKPQLFLVPLPSSVNDGTLCLCRKIYWTKDACIYYTYSPLPKDEADQIMRCSSSVSLSLVTGKNLLTSVNGKFIGVQQIHGFLTFGGTHVLLNQASTAVKPTATVAPNRVGTVNPQKRKHTVLSTPSPSVKITKSSSTPVLSVQPKDIPKSTKSLSMPKLTKQVNLSCPREAVSQPKNHKLTPTNKTKKSTGPQPHLKVKFTWNSRWVSDVNGTNSEIKDISETVTAVTNSGNKKPSESIAVANKSDNTLLTETITGGASFENKEQTEKMTARTKSDNKKQTPTMTRARTKSENKKHMKTMTRVRIKSKYNEQTKTMTNVKTTSKNNEQKKTKIRARTKSEHIVKTKIMTRARTESENKVQKKTVTRARTTSKNREQMKTMTRARSDSEHKVQKRTRTRTRARSDNKKQTEAVTASFDLPKPEDLRFNKMVPRVKLTRLGCEKLKRLGCTTSPLYTSLLSNATKSLRNDVIASGNVQSKVAERRSYELTSLTRHPDLKHIPTNDTVAYLKELLKSQRELLGM